MGLSGGGGVKGSGASLQNINTIRRATNDLIPESVHKKSADFTNSVGETLMMGETTHTKVPTRIHKIDSVQNLVRVDLKESEVSDSNEAKGDLNPIEEGDAIDESVKNPVPEVDDSQEQDSSQEKSRAASEV